MPDDFLARLNAWRALSHEEQLARVSGSLLGPSADGRVRVGLLCPCLNQGGAETWQVALARWTDRTKLDWVGCCGIGDLAGAEFPHDPAMRAHTEELMPVTGGLIAARRLAERCDVLILWAITGVPNLLAGMARKPAVVSACHAPIESPWGRDVYGAASGVDRWVAVSELALPAIPVAAREAIPTSVIWNAVDSTRLEVTRSRQEMRARWGVPPGAKVAGFLGRLSSEKDPHAMRRLIGHLPGDWHAVLVGKGHESVEPHERLRLVGNDLRAGDVLNAFDSLVVPSHYESFCLTMAEGWWMGTPVVSTSVGMARLVPGLTRLVPIDADGPTLARAILEDAADTRGTPGRVARARTFAREHLAPERFGREWTGLILEVAPRAAKTPDLLGMARSFAGAMRDLIADGGRLAPRAVRKARRGCCETCPFHRAEPDSCLKCGCGSVVPGGLTAKLAIASSECPGKPPRWGPV